MVLDLPSDLPTRQGQTSLRDLQHLQMPRTPEDTRLILYDDHAQLISRILHAGDIAVRTDDRTTEELPIVEDGGRLSQTIR